MVSGLAASVYTSAVKTVSQGGSTCVFLAGWYLTNVLVAACYFRAKHASRTAGATLSLLEACPLKLQRAAAGMHSVVLMQSK